MRYVDVLNRGWERHLVPRGRDAPTVVSLFAGCGGSSLGYSMAGFREVLAVEWDDDAVRTFELNFPGVPIYHGDIYNLSIDECLHLTELFSGKLDVLDGSPPCQGFSLMGKRRMEDGRNTLFEEYVRLLRGMMPRVFVMENVEGLVLGKMKLIFARIMRALKESGYRVRCQLLNAKWFDVPQSRDRLIWIGTREDLEIEPTFPVPTEYLWAASDVIQEAAVDDYGMSKGNFAKRMKRLKPGECLADVERTTTGFSYQRLSIGRPANTLTASLTFGGISVWHPRENRNLSIGELKRISSFPDQFTIPLQYREAVHVLGNSVPPFFMQAIAWHIRKDLLGRLH